MARSKRYVSILAMLLAISVSAVLISGCTQNLTAPSPTDGNQQKLDWMNAHLAPGGAQLGSPIDACQVLYDTTMAVWVGGFGSTFGVVNGQERINFTLPAGALSYPLQLTIRVTKYDAPFGKFWLLDCGPEGTVFHKPLQVSPNGTAIDGTKPVLFYFNPESGSWEVEEAAAGNSRLLQINHFSKYGIS